MRLPLSRKSTLLLFGCLTAVLLCAGPSIIGISPYDESVYLADARGMTPGRLITYQNWGPLYCYWYKLLALFCHDPIARYFLSWRLIASFVALLPLVLNLPGAWIYTTMFLVLPMLLINPFVSIFGGSFLLAGMCILLLHRRSTLSDAATLACGLTFVTAFARPEFGFGVLVSAVATLGALALETLERRRSAEASRWAISAAKAAFVLSLEAMMRYVQIASAPGDRLGLAFLQHFNVRAHEFGLLPPNERAFLSNYAIRAFGLIHQVTPDHPYPGLAEYLRANPRLFFGHLLTNLLDPRMLFLLALLSVVLLWPWLRKDRRDLRAASVFLACICFASVAGLIVIFPRDHYVLTIVPSVAIYSLQLLQPWRWMKPTPLWAAVCCLAVAGCLLFSRQYDRGAFALERAQPARLAFAQQIDGASTDPNPWVVNMDGDLIGYVPHPRTAFSHDRPPADWAALQAWIVAHHPAWISYDLRLNDRYQISQAEFERFVQHDLGYVRHVAPQDPGLILYTSPGN